MFINKTDNSAFNFFMPEGFADQKIERPVPMFEKLENIAYGASISIPTKTMEASVTIGDLTGNVAIAVAGTGIASGAKVYAVVTADGASRTVTAGSGVVGDSIVVEDGVTRVVTFLYDGTSWLMF